MGARSGYFERHPRVEVNRLVNERVEAVRWLRPLESPDWTRSRVHPGLGRFSAVAFPAAWAARNALHIRQCAKWMYELARQDAGREPIDDANASGAPARWSWTGAVAGLRHEVLLRLA